MGEITITGGLYWILKICILVLTGSIFLTGSWIIFNYFVWDVLIKWSMIWLGVYRNFVEFIYYRERFKAWFKKYEGTIEPGAND